MNLATSLLAIGLCVLPVLPASAQGEARDLGRFQAAFRPEKKTYKTAAEKRQALAALRVHDSAKVARALIDAYVNLDREAEPLRQRRRPFLERGGGSKLLKQHRFRLQPIRNLQDQIIVRLAGLQQAESVRTMLRALLRPKSKPPLTLEITLAGLAGKLAWQDLPLLTEASEKAKRVEDILLLLAALSRVGRRAGLAAPWAVKMLEHPDAHVRIQAVGALENLCWPQSLEPLVKRLAAEQGRARDAFFETLRRLTGEDPGRSATAWSLWLKKEGGPYLRGEVPLGQGKPKPRAERKARKERKEPQGTGSYFGIPQDGNSILYVFDNSQSMQAPMPGQRQQPKGKRESRMDRCKKELHRALVQLTPKKTFNLIAFANRLRRFDDRMRQATPKNLARAHAWIDALELEFQTNVHDALELAFYSAGRGTEDRFYSVAADTIYFLSDGAPTMPRPARRGIKADSAEEILSAVRRWNPLRRIVIHTIGLGMGRGRGENAKRRRGFMRKLATQNGGRFVVPR